MHTTDLFYKKTVFSFEVFPPKKDMPMDTIYETLEGMKNLHPDFISCTCGAGGGGNNNAVAVSSMIQNEMKIPAICHLPCINFSKEEVVAMLDSLKKEGIENVLALRGDLIPDVEPKKDFKHASDLVEFIKSQGDFNILGACYPEGHPESHNYIDDLRNLKKKVDAGVSHLVSQLFFDNEMFYNFVERARIAGIDVPIEAGIMPVMNKKQIERMATLCGATIPKKFAAMLQKYEHSPEALMDAGVAYAIDQIADLVSNGVDGIHLYTMNKPEVAGRIYNATKSLFEASSSIKKEGSVFGL